MSIFKFRLAALLQLRAATRDERRAALAEGYRVDDVLRRNLEAAAGEIELLHQRRRTIATAGAVNVDQLVESQRYELVVKQREAQLVRQRQGVAAEIQRRREALVEADREVRVLEKLRDRQAEQYRRGEECKEAKRLDEVALQQALREAVA